MVEETGFKFRDVQQQGASSLILKAMRHSYGACTAKKNVILFRTATTGRQ